MVRAALVVKTVPNPVRDELNLLVFQEHAGSLQISMTNPWGQEQELLSIPEANSGETQWRFNMSELPSGTYYLICRQGDGAVERIKVLKL